MTNIQNSNYIYDVNGRTIGIKANSIEGQLIKESGNTQASTVQYQGDEWLMFIDDNFNMSQAKTIEDLNINTVVARFIGGNLTLDELNKWLNSKGINPKNQSSSDNQTSISFEYEGKNYDLKCSTDAAQYQADNITVAGASYTTSVNIVNELKGFIRNQTEENIMYFISSYFNIEPRTLKPIKKLSDEQIQFINDHPNMFHLTDVTRGSYRMDDYIQEYMDDWVNNHRWEDKETINADGTTNRLSCGWPVLVDENANSIKASPYTYNEGEYDIFGNGNGPGPDGSIPTKTPGIYVKRNSDGSGTTAYYYNSITKSYTSVSHGAEIDAGLVMFTFDHGTYNNPSMGGDIGAHQAFNFYSENEAGLYLSLRYGYNQTSQYGVYEKDGKFYQLQWNYSITRGAHLLENILPSLFIPATNVNGNITVYPNPKDERTTSTNSTTNTTTNSTNNTTTNSTNNTTSSQNNNGTTGSGAGASGTGSTGTVYVEEDGVNIITTNSPGSTNGNVPATAVPGAEEVHDGFDEAARIESFIRNLEAADQTALFGEGSDQNGLFGLAYIKHFLRNPANQQAMNAINKDFGKLDASNIVYQAINDKIYDPVLEMLKLAAGVTKNDKNSEIQDKLETLFGKIDGTGKQAHMYDYKLEIVDVMQYLLGNNSEKVNYVATYNAQMTAKLDTQTEAYNSLQNYGTEHATLTVYNGLGKAGTPPEGAVVTEIPGVYIKDHCVLYVWDQTSQSYLSVTAGKLRWGLNRESYDQLIVDAIKKGDFSGLELYPSMNGGKFAAAIAAIHFGMNATDEAYVFEKDGKFYQFNADIPQEMENGVVIREAYNGVDDMFDYNNGSFANKFSKLFTEVDRNLGGYEYDSSIVVDNDSKTVPTFEEQAELGNKIIEINNFITNLTLPITNEYNKQTGNHQYVYYVEDEQTKNVDSARYGTVSYKWKNEADKQACYEAFIACIPKILEQYGDILSSLTFDGRKFVYTLNGVTGTSTIGVDYEMGGSNGAAIYSSDGVLADTCEKPQAYIAPTVYRTNPPKSLPVDPDGGDMIQTPWDGIIMSTSGTVYMWDQIEQKYVGVTGGWNVMGLLNGDASVLPFNINEYDNLLMISLVFGYNRTNSNDIFEKDGKFYMIDLCKLQKFRGIAALVETDLFSELPATYVGTESSANPAPTPEDDTVDEPEVNPAPTPEDDTVDEPEVNLTPAPEDNTVDEPEVNLTPALEDGTVDEPEVNPAPVPEDDTVVSSPSVDFDTTDVDAEEIEQALVALVTSYLDEEISSEEFLENVDTVVSEIQKLEDTDEEAITEQLILSSNEDYEKLREAITARFGLIETKSGSCIYYSINDPTGKKYIYNPVDKTFIEYIEPAKETEMSPQEKRRDAILKAQILGLDFTIGFPFICKKGDDYYKYDESQRTFVKI